MSGSEYLWAPGEELPLIGDHSLAKHEVLGRYLRTYVQVLTRDPVIAQLKLTLVDGFAGGGAYTTSRGEMHYGSPLQMVHAMRDASLDACARRTKPFSLDAKFIFIEKEPRNNEVLAALLKTDPACKSLVGAGKIMHWSGTFEEHASSVVDQVRLHGKRGRAIIVLDQYGYKDVPLTMINRIMRELPHAEVLLTFATDWLLDYLSHSGRGVSRERLAEMNLSGMEAEFDSILQAKEHKSSGWRRWIQSFLHHDLVKGTGAKYFTPFFIVSPGAHREYWFVHLSRHAKARDEMAKLHWLLQNRFAHYGRAGLGMLGYDPENDANMNRQMPFDFSAGAQEEAFARLREEIPEWLRKRGNDGATFETFFDSVCNQTPVTSEHLRSLIQEMSLGKELEVLSFDRSYSRRPGVKLNSDDIVRCPPQLFLDLGRGRWRP